MFRLLFLLILLLVFWPIINMAVSKLRRVLIKGARDLAEEACRSQNEK